MQIKELDLDELELNDLFIPIVLNANGKYTLNNGLFYSDGIKINDSKFVTIFISEDLLDLLICMFDLYNNDKSLRLRYFYLPLENINIKISVNIHAFEVGNFLGLILFNSKSNYPGYTLFINNNYIINTSKYIEIFIDSSSYSFSFQENIFLMNNIFGGKIEKIKINSISNNNFDYEIYTKNGKNITNLSIFDNVNIEISIPIKDLDSINFYEAEYLSKQGYDIYNKSSNFYYDYCLSTYINESELSVDLRQQKIYQKNVSLCKDVCSYKSINYEEKRVII